MLFALGEKAACRAAHAEQLKASIGQAELAGLADATLQILHEAGVAHYRKCAIAPVANKAGTGSASRSRRSRQARLGM